MGVRPGHRSGSGAARAGRNEETRGRRGRQALVDWCRSHDGGPYPAYKDLRGCFQLEGLDLEMLRIQPDPYAGPSRARLRFPYGVLGLAGPVGDQPGGLGTEIPGIVDPRSARSVGIRDFLGRWIGRWLGRRGAGGRRPALQIDRHCQQVLDRSCVLLYPDALEVRLHLDLPARGRRILGREAAHHLIELPERLLTECLGPDSLDLEAMARHADAVEDFALLQAGLDDRGWVAFVADGSRLARRAGHDDRPLSAGPVVAFESPASLRAQVELPHAGTVTGLALEPGVTLLCGGGFHGKSTLLRAISASVYPHVPGDGRERIATVAHAQSIRAEDGRAMTDIDLRPFIRDLPFDQPSDSFSTENASGSTSQAGGILEAIQGGSRFLLIDEDTSATNFMIRDPMMDALLADHSEPITPFLAQARTLYEGLGVSSLLVIGGSGEYFRVADRVILLDTYRPQDKTPQAHRIAAERAVLLCVADEVARFRRAIERGRQLPTFVPDRSGGRGSRGPGRQTPRIRAVGPRALLVDRIPLDLQGVESLRDLAQARFVGELLTWRMRELFSGASSDRRRAEGVPGQSVAELGRAFLDTWRSGTLDGFGLDVRGDFAAVRFVDFLAAVNRLRSRRAPGIDWGLAEDSQSDEN